MPIRSVQDVNAATDIEITPEMVEAGAEVMLEKRDLLTVWRLAELVYRDMERARLGRA